MAHHFQLDITSAEKEIFAGEISLLSVTGAMGELGIMPGHTPLLTMLKPGNIVVRLPNNEEIIFYISGGMLEVQPAITTILADTVLRAQDIDEQKAVEAKMKAEKILREKKDDIDFARASSELAEALAQIQAITKLKNKMKR